MRVSRYTYTSTRKDDWKIIISAFFILGIGIVIGGVGGIFLFIRITGGNALPSQPISAPTLSLESLNTSTLVPEIPSTTNPTSPATPVSVTPLATEVPSESAILSPQLFRIVPEASEARFYVYETMPVGTAVGRTNQVAGDIVVDFNTPTNSQLGTIRINLRTLTTGNSDRDSSIRCCVLLTAQQQYEFADFVPTGITGLPERVQIGDTVQFWVSGNLTVRGVTSSVTFDVSLSLNSSSEIEGFARSTINRLDFGIMNDTENMFDYHGVAEEITLEFDFLAEAVSQ